MIASETLPNRPSSTVYQIGDKVARDGYTGTVTAKSDSDITVDFDQTGKEPNVIPLHMARKWLKKVPKKAEHLVHHADNPDSLEATTDLNAGTIAPTIHPLDADGLTEATAILTTQGKFAQYQATYSADKLDQPESRIKGTFGYQDRQWVCLMVHGAATRHTVRCYEVVPQSSWDGELVDRAGMKERQPFSYEGLLAKCKKAALVFTGREVWFYTVTQSSAPIKQEAEMEATYPIGSKVKVRLNLYGETREAVGIVVPTMTQGTDGKPREYHPVHQVSVEWECILPPIEAVHEYYHEHYPAGGIARGTSQIMKGNVEILPEQGMQPGTQTVALSHITVDPDLQPRANGLDEPAIAEYQEAMAGGVWDWSRNPMIGYWSSATGILRLAVGGHRLEAAKRAGLPSIVLDVRLEDDPEATAEAVLVATTDNMQHGVRLSTADKNKAIELMLKAPHWAQQSDSALARILTSRGLRCDHKKVGQIRKSLEADGIIEPVTDRIATRVKTGTSYVQKAPKPAAKEEYTYEQVRALYASLGDFSANPDPKLPYRFEAIGVTQRFKSLEDAAKAVAWIGDRVEAANDRIKPDASCKKCVMQELTSETEFLCTALNTNHDLTDDPGAAGCRHFQQARRRRDDTAPFSLPAGVTEPPPVPAVAPDIDREAEAVALLATKQAAGRAIIKSAIARYLSECEDFTLSAAELDKATTLLEGTLNTFASSVIPF